MKVQIFILEETRSEEGKSDGAENLKFVRLGQVLLLRYEVLKGSIIAERTFVNWVDHWLIWTDVLDLTVDANDVDHDEYLEKGTDYAHDVVQVNWPFFGKIEV